MNSSQLEKKLINLIISGSDLQQIVNTIRELKKNILIPHLLSGILTSAYIKAAEVGHIDFLNYLTSEIKPSQLLIKKSIESAKKREQWEACAFLEDFKK